MLLFPPPPVLCDALVPNPHRVRADVCQRGSGGGEAAPRGSVPVGVRGRRAQLYPRSLNPSHHPRPPAVLAAAGAGGGVWLGRVLGSRGAAGAARCEQGPARPSQRGPPRRRHQRLAAPLPGSRRMRGGEAEVRGRRKCGGRVLLPGDGGGGAGSGVALRRRPSGTGGAPGWGSGGAAGPAPAEGPGGEGWVGAGRGWGGPGPGLGLGPAPGAPCGPAPRAAPGAGSGHGTQGHFCLLVRSAVRPGAG